MEGFCAGREKGTSTWDGQELKSKGLMEEAKPESGPDLSWKSSKAEAVVDPGMTSWAEQRAEEVSTRAYFLRVLSDSYPLEHTSDSSLTHPQS